MPGLPLDLRLQPRWIAPPTGNPHALIVCGGECASLSHWGGVGTPTIGTHARTGNGVIRIGATGPAQAFDYVFQAISSPYVVAKFSLFLDALPSADSNFWLARTNGPGGADSVVGFDQAAGKLAVYNSVDGWANRTAAATTIVPGRWYTVDVYLDASSTGPKIRWRIDGVDQTTNTGSAAAGIYDIGVYFGQNTGTGLNGLTTWTGYYDDVILSIRSSDYPIPDGTVAIVGGTEQWVIDGPPIPQWVSRYGDDPTESTFFPDDTDQSVEPVPPLNAVADQSWNLDDSERFVPSTFVPDDTPAALGEPPLNASQKVAFDGDSEVPPYVPGQDDTPAPFVGVPLNATQKTAWSDDTGEQFVPDQFRPDDTPPAFGEPPLNVTQLTAFNGDPEVAQAVPVADETIQAWAVQSVGVAAPFDPSTGFPWNAEEGERWAQSQVVDDATPAPLVGIPLNATTAQAFNQPDEATFVPVTDDTAQAYSIQPVAAAAFDPSTGFPWPVDVIVQPVWSVTDDTAQAWTPTPVPFIGNIPHEIVPEPWVIEAIASPSWIAAQGGVVVVTGGRGPDSGSAYDPTPPGYATAPRPGGSATAPLPAGSASNPRPQR